MRKEDVDELRQKVMVKQQKEVEAFFLQSIKDGTYSSEKLEKVINFPIDCYFQLTLPFIDLEINDDIRYTRRNVIKNIYENKRMYPILKMPNYVNYFFEISTFLKIGYPCVPTPPNEPKNKPQKPVYSNYINVPEGKYIEITKLELKELFENLGCGGIFVVLLCLLVFGPGTFMLVGALFHALFRFKTDAEGYIFVTIFILILIILFLIKDYEKGILVFRKKKELFYYTKEEKAKIREDLLERRKMEHKQSMEQYDKNIDTYEKKMEKYRKEVEIFNIDFDKWKQNMNENYLDWLDKELMSTIKRNKSSNYQRAKNTKKGFSEDKFFMKLYHRFREEIKIDTALEYYYPDIAIVINNIIIDVEIDEPYTFDEKKEIHYIDDKGIHIDKERDNFFLGKNWFVLRFSEEQTVKHADTCVELISLVAQFIKTANIGYLCDYMKLSESIQQNQWTYEDAKFMALTNSRKG